MFCQPRQMRALCSDGTVRVAHVTAEPDTFFSIPARVSVRGKTVAGFVTPGNNGTLDSPQPVQWHFVAYDHRKNGYLLPGLPA